MEGNHYSTALRIVRVVSATGHVDTNTHDAVQLTTPLTTQLTTPLTTLEWPGICAETAPQE